LTTLPHTNSLCRWTFDVIVDGVVVGDVVGDGDVIGKS